MTNSRTTSDLFFPASREYPSQSSLFQVCMIVDVHHHHHLTSYIIVIFTLFYTARESCNIVFFIFLFQACNDVDHSSHTSYSYHKSPHNSQNVSAILSSSFFSFRLAMMYHHHLTSIHDLYTNYYITGCECNIVFFISLFHVCID